MNPPTLRGADLVVRTLEKLGVRAIFSLSGNHIMPIFDALIGSQIALIHVRQEAAAVHMADAYARTSGALGVALVTGGQGHANACSALFTAQTTEAPLLLLSGHAATDEIGFGAFQELRQAEVAVPMTKAAWTATQADELAHLLARASALARGGRAGPVHVSLPFDLLERSITDTATLWPAPSAAEPPPMPLGEADATTIRALLGEAERPLVLCGPGMASRDDRARVAQLQSALSIPVVVMESPRGINDPGLGAFAEVLAEADLVALLGKPLDFTLRFGRAPFVAEDAGWIAIDADGTAAERIAKAGSNRLRSAAHAEPKQAIEALLAAPDLAASEARRRWLARVEAALHYRPAAWQARKTSTTGAIHPLVLCGAVQRFIDAHEGALLVCDGGEIGQWLQAGVDAPERMINGVAGSIGPGLPFALGACAARRQAGIDAPVVVVMGDGTAGFHIAELDTALRHRLPVIVVIGNDARWNAEYQIQIREYGASRALHCELLPTRYDQVAAGFGAHPEFVTDASQLDAAFARARQSGLPACLNVMIESERAPIVRRAAP